MFKLCSLGFSFLFDKLHFTIFNTFCITSIMDFTVKASGVIFFVKPRFFFLSVNRKLSGNRSLSWWQQPEHEWWGQLRGRNDGQGWGGGEAVQQHDGEHRGGQGHRWVSQVLYIYKESWQVPVAMSRSEQIHCNRACHGGNNDIALLAYCMYMYFMFSWGFFSLKNCINYISLYYLEGGGCILVVIDLNF